MNGTIIVPIIKSPHSKGRIGPEKFQDWFRGLKKAVSIAIKSDGEILVISDAQYTNQSHESNLYCKALAKLSQVRHRVIRNGRETTEQVDLSFKLAEVEKKELVFISTFFHYPRVQWLIWRCKSKKLKVSHYISFGIPRPREMLTDIVLAFMFPLIDILGGRQLFIRAVNKRRIEGKL